MLKAFVFLRYLWPHERDLRSEEGNTHKCTVPCSQNLGHKKNQNFFKECYEARQVIGRIISKSYKPREVKRPFVERIEIPRYRIKLLL